MNFRYLVGTTVSRLRHAALRARWLPLSRVVPMGLSWAYDVQRIADSRDLAVLVDAGANVGQTSRHLAGYFPGAAIHAFEPVQATWQALRAATRHLPLVRCVPCALGAAPGRAPIYLRPNSEMNTLVRLPGATSTEDQTIETIEVETLDRTMEWNPSMC